MRLVPTTLPVECHLQRVLDGQRAAVDEEQMRKGRITQHPRECVDKTSHLDGVDVGIARLVDGSHGQFGTELIVLGQHRMIHAQR
ncbi:Uncharacterised protein [Mycobacteroides abscessus subsp. massiliense]|nr:Uncharacterised protein [Mycobacteroides abscessus subsp. massiliense]